MQKVNVNDSFRVFGVKFENINEVIRYAIDGTPKNGVYVGEDSQRYPCFDSEDYATENRYYWNFVFAHSKGELQQKLDNIKNRRELQCNYNKFTEELAPMVYWEGDTNHSVFLTNDICVKTFSLGSVIEQVKSWLNCLM